MPLMLKCPGCTAVLKLDERMAGQKFQCTRCQKWLNIPSGSRPKPAPEPPARTAPTPAAKPKVQSPPKLATDSRPKIVPAPASVKPERSAAPKPSVGSPLSSPRSRPVAPAEKRGSAVRLWALIGGGAFLVLTATAVGFLWFGPSNAPQPVAQTASSNPTSPGNSDSTPLVEPRENKTPEVQPKAIEPAPIANPLPEKAPADIAPEMVVKVKQSTVYIKTTLATSGQSQGTGFFAQEPGVVFTNAHVVGLFKDDAPRPSKIEIVVSSGEKNEASYTASILGVDRKNDLALLKVDADVSKLPAPLLFDTSDKLIELQKVYIFGFPFGSTLGKNITVSASSVSSLRRDPDGIMQQVQVNGGMNPGNSGGPVVDSRGAVVGLAVAIISGTQINFAIPSDQAQAMLRGRYLDMDWGEPYQAGGQINVPIMISFLDPLHRLSELKAEYWIGNPGPVRPAPVQAPEARAGDGPHQAIPLTYSEGMAKADIPLPALEASQALWLQVVAKSGTSKLWTPASAFARSQAPPLERIAIKLQQKLIQEPKRTLNIKGSSVLTIRNGNEKAMISEKLQLGALEDLSATEKGTKVSLQLGPIDYLENINGKSLKLGPSLIGLTRKHPPSYTIDATGLVKVRHNPPALKTISPQAKELYYSLANYYEIGALPIPENEVKPLETWPSRQGLLLRKDGKPDYHDLNLTCSYEGVRTDSNRKEAFIRLAGEVKGKTGPKAGKVVGKVKGLALFDLDKGFISKVNVSITTDAGAGLIQALFVIELDMVRTPGHTITAVEAPTPAEPTPTTTGQRTTSLTATLGRLEKKDSKGSYYRAHNVPMKAGHQYALELSQVAGNFVPHLFVIDKATKKVAEETNSSQERAARLSFAPTEEGTFLVVVRNQKPNETGQYNLKIIERSAP